MALFGMLRGCRRLVGGVAALLLAGVVHGEVTPEQPGSTTLGPPSSSWFIIKNVMGSGSVFDAANGEMLGTLSLTPWTPTVVTHPERREVYAAEVFYARQHDGERTDVLRIYAHETLAPVAEVPLPPKVASLHQHYMALLEGDRYVVVFNMTPAQSVSVVDVVERRFVGEISTPGCASTLAAGERGFLMVCGNGTLQWIGLDANGEEAARVRSGVFFDVDEDPLFGKPVPSGDGWQFMTFAGQAMTASVEGGEHRRGRGVVAHGRRRRGLVARRHAAIHGSRRNRALGRAHPPGRERHAGRGWHRGMGVPSCRTTSGRQNRV